jgi:hypothetical protein
MNGSCLTILFDMTQRSAIEFEVGISVPDNVDDLLTIWQEDHDMLCILLDGNKDVKSKSFRFEDTLQPVKGFRTKALIRFDITEKYIRVSGFRVEGLPKWSLPLDYDHIAFDSPVLMAALDYLDLTIHYVYRG